MMKLARSRFGGLAACFLLDKMSAILPIKVLEKNQHVTVLQHPSPSYPVHELAVPRKRKENIFELLQDKESYLAVAEVLRKRGESQGLLTACNFGARQDVKQVHFHLYEEKNFHLNEKSDRVQRLMLDEKGTVAFCDEDGNCYVQYRAIGNILYMAALLKVIQKRFSTEFTLIFY